jgi:tRNA1Val (adenine37-N6)-methyltransferase
LKIVGMEVQENLASQAQRSVMLNGLDDRITVQVRDWRDASSRFPPHSFDLVFANPPFRAVGTGRVSPRAEVALAKHGPQGALKGLLKAASWVLRARGILALIYHVSSLAELVGSLRQANLEPKYLCLVHSLPESEAEFALVGACKEGRTGLKAWPPLILFSAKGGPPSPELEAIYRSFRPAREGNRR